MGFYPGLTRFISAYLGLPEAQRRKETRKEDKMEGGGDGAQ